MAANTKELMVFYPGSAFPWMGPGTLAVKRGPALIPRRSKRGPRGASSSPAQTSSPLKLWQVPFPAPFPRE